MLLIDNSAPQATQEPANIEGLEQVRPGVKFKRARVAVGWTQAKTDEFLGANPGWTQSIERKASTVVNPRRDRLEKAANAWQIPVEWFYDGADDSPPIGAVSALTTQLPVRAPLPSSRPDEASASGTLPCLVAFPVPSGSHYRFVVGDRNDLNLLDGDRLLLIPVDVTWRGKLGVVRSDGGIDVCQVDSGQTAEYHVVEMMRVKPGGVRVAWESATGLSSPFLVE